MQLSPHVRRHSTVGILLVPLLSLLWFSWQAESSVGPDYQKGAGIGPHLLKQKLDLSSYGRVDPHEPSGVRHFTTQNCSTTEEKGSKAGLQATTCQEEIRPTTASDQRTEVVLAAFITSRRDPQRYRMPTYKDKFAYMAEWYESVHQQGLYGIVVHDGLSDAFISTYTTDNVRFFKVSSPDDFLSLQISGTETIATMGPAEFRMLGFLEYLLRHPEVEYAFLTDISDVVYKKNPFPWVRERREDLFYAFEEKPHEDFMVHAWAGCAPDEEFTDRHQRRKTFAAGMFGGRREALILHFLQLKLLLEDLYDRPEPPVLPLGKICDMVAHNKVVHTWLDNPTSSMRNRIWQDGQPLFNRILRLEDPDAETEEELAQYSIVHIHKRNPLDSAPKVQGSDGWNIDDLLTLPDVELSAISDSDFNDAFLLQEVGSGRCIVPAGSKDFNAILLDSLCLLVLNPATFFRWLPGGQLQHLESGKCLHPLGMHDTVQKGLFVVRSLCRAEGEESGGTNYLHLPDGRLQDELSGKCLHATEMHLLSPRNRSIAYRKSVLNFNSCEAAEGAVRFRIVPVRTAANDRGRHKA